ncbi:carbon starvation CstA family protein [Thermobrachium celere]|uniref:Carbon starvation protein A n=1 Tax=Thermobrachium celere DSM 8682 TaxID=941824 RepID=R7RPQ1_9CLOT|nr:carbon starvation CstA family protein [Thermobrachium celere]CDF58172.1 Carbon starvation protein A [Thermobrachium celere DSM 8682]
MYSFIFGIILLVLGYIVYGKYVEKQFGVDEKRMTPAYTLQDGVDYVPMPTWKVYLIQLLNIAGLGPIFGAIQGALFGPAAFLWIVFGSIFAGAVHDYLSGMISIRHKGASLSEIQGIYLGKKVQNVMRIFTIVLLVLVGVVFVTGPAKLLAAITPSHMTLTFWVVVVFAYYFLATILPIDVVIGNLYPLFGIALVVMAVGVGGGIILKGYHIPEITMANLHPKKLPIFPMMFITIACGAISGFHATQSPLMARCMKNEKYGRSVFYGAMIAEGIIALVWAAAGMAFYKGVPGLAAVLGKVGPSGVVLEITKTILGPVGGVLAMLGVVACPITSGDTAFRGARLMLSDMIKVPQDKIVKRLALALPLFAIGIALTFINFDIIWRYFAWANQTLAMVTLWATAVYLLKYNKNYWIAVIPAVFMSYVSVSYIMQAKEGFKMPASISNIIGLVVAGILLVLFLTKASSFAKTIENVNEEVATTK